MRKSALVLMTFWMIAASGAQWGAQAQESGLASMHDWKQYGRLMCMAEHTHLGSSSGQVTEKIAIREAVANWSGFTAFEYGDAWANWRHAKGKTIKCSKSRSGHGCEVVARPCKRLSRQEARQARAAYRARARAARRKKK